MSDEKEKRVVRVRFFLSFVGCFFVTIGVTVLMSCKLFEKKAAILAPQDIQFAIPHTQIKKVILDNGMTVLACQNKRIPKVLVQIAYDIGSGVEEQGERGLAHLLEHMIFKGTKILSEGDIDAIARKYGASHNAFTSKDVTSYYFEANKNNWKPFVSILADCMKNARFDEQHLASELLAVIQELKMCKDRYWTRMFEKANELAYPPNYPYHFPIIGYKEDLATISAAKLKHFYEKYYSPSHALLMIIGDIDLDDAIDEAKKQFAHLARGHQEDLSHRFCTLTPDLTSNKTKIYEAVQKEQLGFYWVVPGIKSGKAHIVQALVDVLGGSEGSRLVKRLVDTDKIAHGAMLSSSDHMESTIIFILIEPKQGKTEACRKVVTEELNKLITEGVKPFELNRLVQGEAVQFFSHMEDLQDFASEWLTSYFATRDEFDLFKHIDRLQHINSEMLCSFAKEYLDPLFMHQIELVPLPEGKKVIWEQAKKASDELDTLILANHVRTTEVEEPSFVYSLPEPNPLKFTFPAATRKFTLANGLRVVLHKDDHIPLMNVQCQFRDVAYFSNALEGTLIDFMMGMLMEGSEEYSKDELVDYFESLGVDYGFDATGGHILCLTRDANSVLERFFTVLTKPVFGKSAFEKQKQNLVHSFISSKDNPKAVAMRMLKNVLSNGSSTCSWSFDDAIELVQKASVSDLKALHKKHVVPAHMLLSITGAFNVDELQAELERIFGSWSGSAYVESTYDYRGFIPKTKIDIEMLRDQTVLLFGSPSPLTIYDPELPYVRMLNIIAFNSLGSRLYELRERTGLFYTAQGSWANSAERQGGFNYVFALLNPSNVIKAEAEIYKTMKTFIDNGVLEEEVSAVRQMYLNGLIDMTSTLGSLASMFARLELLGLAPSHYDTVLEKVQTVSVDTLNQIAKKQFETESLARIRVGRVKDF